MKRTILNTKGKGLKHPDVDTSKVVLRQDSSSQRHEPKEGQTFRIRGVPPSWTPNQLRDCLAEEVAKQDDSARPTVHSLAQEVHGRSSTATVTFSNIPCQLQTERPWAVSPPIAPNASGRPPVLVLDKDFLGITTLYCPQAQDHTVE